MKWILVFLLVSASILTLHGQTVRGGFSGQVGWGSPTLSGSGHMPNIDGDILPQPGIRHAYGFFLERMLDEKFGVGAAFNFSFNDYRVWYVYNQKKFDVWDQMNVVSLPLYGTFSQPLNNFLSLELAAGVTVDYQGHYTHHSWNQWVNDGSFDGVYLQIVMNEKPELNLSPPIVLLFVTIFLLHKKDFHCHQGWVAQVRGAIFFW